MIQRGSASDSRWAGPPRPFQLFPSPGRRSIVGVMSSAEVNPAHALGRWGEDQAARYLARRGWRVLARNYRFGRREVDLVVRKGTVVAFVEVKTRAGTGFGAPQEAITGFKRQEIEAVAMHFLKRHGFTDVEVRFDAVGIVVNRETRVLRLEHVPDAWRPGWT